MRFFITGTAGFIGFHLASRLLADGHTVVGYDGMTSYYDVRLKELRHNLLRQHPNFSAVEALLEDRATLETAWTTARPDIAIHLAAQAGVRYSLENPASYVSSNVSGSFNILELARHHKVKHLLLASTSSIYGLNEKVPFEEADKSDIQISIYSSTKKAMESMSHSYSHLFDIPVTCFRFFTVYGPYGRPDMSLFKFVDAILHDRPIDIYGNGNMKRDFTYIADLVEGICRLVDCIPETGKPVTAPGVTDTLSPVAPHRIVNIGGGAPVDLLDFVSTVERMIGRPAIRNYLPMQPGDVPITYASHHLLEALTGFRPEITVEEGVAAFVEWYRGCALFA